MGYRNRDFHGDCTPNRWRVVCPVGEPFGEDEQLRPHSGIVEGMEQRPVLFSETLGLVSQTLPQFIELTQRRRIEPHPAARQADQGPGEIMGERSRLVFVRHVAAKDRRERGGLDEACERGEVAMQAGHQRGAGQLGRRVRQTAAGSPCSFTIGGRLISSWCKAK
jgi:hypothetical protein